MHSHGSQPHDIMSDKDSVTEIYKKIARLEHARPAPLSFAAIESQINECLADYCRDAHGKGLTHFKSIVVEHDYNHYGGNFVIKASSEARRHDIGALTVLTHRGISPRLNHSHYFGYMADLAALALTGPASFVERLARKTLKKAAVFEGKMIKYGELDTPPGWLARQEKIALENSAPASKPQPAPPPRRL